MRVLVTGGTGYLGRAIVGALVAAGHGVTAFARAATDAALPARSIDGDIRDRRSVLRAAEGCDAVVHAAALVSIWQRHRDSFDDVNIGGLENAVAALRHAGLSRMVYTSSFLARPPMGRREPLCANDYQRTKAEALRRVQHYRREGVPVVTLVPGVIYGPGLGTEGNLIGRLVGDHLAGRLPGIVGGGRIWSFAFVDDVAAAHVAALEGEPREGEYGLGGENAPQRAVFEWLRSRAGRQVPRDLPVWLAATAGAIEEARVRLTGGKPLLTRGAVEIFRHDWPVDSAAAERDLGYRARRLHDGLDRTIDLTDPSRPRLSPPR